MGGVKKMNQTKLAIHSFSIILLLSSQLFVHCSENSQEPKRENITKDSGTLEDTLKCHYGVWETSELPITKNYFEFKITWAYLFESYKEKSWRLIFKPSSEKIQRIPEDGNRLLAPVEGYSGEEYSFLYLAPSIPPESKNRTTFFYLSADKTLFGRLDCSSEYSMTSLSNGERSIYVKLVYNWVVKTDGSRNFPE